MIVQIDADPAQEVSYRSSSEFLEPDRLQIALRVYGPKSTWTTWQGTCPRRWLITMAGATYYEDAPNEDWD